MQDWSVLKIWNIYHVWILSTDPDKICMDGQIDGEGKNNPLAKIYFIFLKIILKKHLHCNFLFHMTFELVPFKLAAPVEPSLMISHKITGPLEK